MPVYFTFTLPSLPSLFEFTEFLLYFSKKVLLSFTLPSLKTPYFVLTESFYSLYRVLPRAFSEHFTEFYFTEFTFVKFYRVLLTEFKKRFTGKRV